jgi:hypothetical protein
MLSAVVFSALTNKASAISDYDLAIQQSLITAEEEALARAVRMSIEDEELRQAIQNSIATYNDESMVRAVEESSAVFSAEEQQRKQEEADLQKIIELSMQTTAVEDLKRFKAAEKIRLEQERIKGLEEERVRREAEAALEQARQQEAARIAKEEEKKLQREAELKRILLEEEARKEAEAALEQAQQQEAARIAKEEEKKLQREAEAALEQAQQLEAARLAKEAVVEEEVVEPVVEIEEINPFDQIRAVRVQLGYDDEDEEEDDEEVEFNQNVAKPALERSESDQALDKLRAALKITGSEEDVVLAAKDFISRDAIGNWQVQNKVGSIRKLLKSFELAVAEELKAACELKNKAEKIAMKKVAQVSAAHKKFKKAVKKKAKAISGSFSFADAIKNGKGLLGENKKAAVEPLKEDPYAKFINANVEIDDDVYDDEDWD